MKPSRSLALLVCASLALVLSTRCNDALPTSAPEVNCGDALDNDGDGLPDCTDPDCLTAPRCARGRPVDVLLVIDSGAGMAQAQRQLIEAFAGFTATLAADTDLRVAVISADLGTGPHQVEGCTATGDSARLQARQRVAGCVPPPAGWIEHAGGKAPAVDGGAGALGDTVATQLACIAALGTSGCRFKQPLEAARLALGRGGAAAFLRPGSVLAVVILAGDDDCSVPSGSQLFDPSQDSPVSPLGPLQPFRCFEFGVDCDIDDRHVVGQRQHCRAAAARDLVRPLSDYQRSLTGLRPDVVLAAIAGPTERIEVGIEGTTSSLASACDALRAPSTEARPAVRLASLVEQLDGIFGSLCDRTGAEEVLAEVAARINTARGVSAPGDGGIGDGGIGDGGIGDGGIGEGGVGDGGLDGGPELGPAPFADGTVDPPGASDSTVDQPGAADSAATD